MKATRAKTGIVSRNFIPHIFVIVAFFIIFCGIDPRIARADAAPPPDPTVSGIGPYQPQKTNVQMLSETVLIELPAVSPTPQEPKWYSDQIDVNASFNMRNQGQAEEKMQVIFPLTRLDFPWLIANYEIIPSSFMAKVNGQSVPITEITTPPEMTYLPKNGDPISPTEGKFYQDVQWAAFDVTFPVQQDVLLEVEYKMGGYSGFTGIEYILETGAGWYGTILSADIIVRLPYTATQEMIQAATPGYVFSDNDIFWKMKNFEPERKDNLYVRVINSYDWPLILELRSKVEQNPDDADAWYELGNEYSKLGLRFQSGLCSGGWPYSITSQHFVDLAVEAYEKASLLHPDWGKAHFKLANVLWFGNQNVEESFSHSDHSNLQIFEADTPYIQTVLQELQSAWSYGITMENAECEVSRLLSYLNSAMPELALTPTSTETVTLVPQTEMQTSTSTPTLLKLPTDVPSQTPTATPLSAQTKDSMPIASIGLVIGLLFVIGVLIYFWQARNARP